MAEQQQRLQALTEEYQKLQTGVYLSPSLPLPPYNTCTNLFPDLQNSISSRQKLESQQQENKGVQKVPPFYHSYPTNLSQQEGPPIQILNHITNPSPTQEFSALDSTSNIYKLVGPVLLKQDKTEAVMAVDGRLEFIDKEMWVMAPPPFFSTLLLPLDFSEELRYWNKLLI